MSQPFPIIVVPKDAAVATEAMGTKFKFWFHHPELGYCLYKQARPNTGEDWAEKIASQ
ncbi:MAG TPA: HipA-like protein, partial [Cyanobacteria bacterium UBA11368]|nr:HipA-like protein [Cyanobacteria bacterium UBA11368]